MVLRAQSSLGGTQIKLMVPLGKVTVFKFQNKATVEVVLLLHLLGQAAVG